MIVHVLESSRLIQLHFTQYSFLGPEGRNTTSYLQQTELDILHIILEDELWFHIIGHLTLSIDPSCFEPCPDLGTASATDESETIFRDAQPF